MSRRFFTVVAGLWAVSAIPVLALPAPGGGADISPPNTIVLFVAGWCAPCRAELGRLTDLVVAARPLNVRVVVLDDSRSSREMMRGIPVAQLWKPNHEAFTRLHEQILASSAGLPYSVAFDEHGQRCAERRDGLEADRVRDIVHRCLTQPHPRRDLP